MILREDQLDVRSQALGERQARRRIDVARDQRRIVEDVAVVGLLFEPDGIEPHGAADDAEELAREQPRQVFTRRRRAPDVPKSLASASLSSIPVDSDVTLRSHGAAGGQRRSMPIGRLPILVCAEKFTSGVMVRGLVRSMVSRSTR